MRRLFAIIAVGFVFSFGPQQTRPVHASGFPVVDIASIAQSVTGYMQQLSDMQEQLNQLSALDNQRIISNADWNKLLKQTIAYYGKGDFSTIPNLRVSSPTFTGDLDTVLRQTHHLPRPESEVTNDYQAMTGTAPSAEFRAQMNRIYKGYDKYKDVQAEVAKNAENSENRKLIINSYANVVRNLGDESDLATLQTMASQNQIMFDQNEASIQVLNQILQQQGAAEAERHAREAARIDREISRLQRATSTTAPLMGRSRWGEL